MLKAGVIGAGIGGLAIACLLANDGYEVTVYEKNDSAGGKLNQVIYDGYRFDTGPSLLTMPYLLDQVFALCDEDIEDYLEVEPLDLLCRYFYPDGTIFNCYSDKEKTLNEIKKIAPGDIKAYSNFLNYSEDIYDRTFTSFLLNPLNSWLDFLGLRYVDLLRIDAFSTVANRVDTYFESEYLRKFFKRFTTYNGSSPFKAPATFNIIPHVELTMGGYYIRNGMYRLIEAFIKLAEKSGVIINFNSDVQHIGIEDNKVSHLIINGEHDESFDLIVSNSDASETYLNLLPDNAFSYKKKEKIEKLEPSCSGFVLLLGSNKTFPQLDHHNLFFSTDYHKEFEQIFDDRVMPDDPTIYVTNTSHRDHNLSPEGGSNLFVMVNAPYLSSSYEWEKQGEAYADKIISELEKRGLEGLRESIEFKHTITPEDFYKKYRSNKGSIYGTSSNNKLSAFIRPRNKSPYVKNLYLVGGSTHPGGGIPLVILSTFHAMRLITRDFQ